MSFTLIHLEFEVVVSTFLRSHNKQHMKVW